VLSYTSGKGASRDARVFILICGLVFDISVVVYLWFRQGLGMFRISVVVYLWCRQEGMRVISF
jgi:hypothetical protein